MKSKNNKEKDMPVFEILKNIKDGTINPDLVSKETREMCVEALVGEGYTSGQIASLLKKSDRTIRRDMAEVRKQNSIEASPEFSQMIAGEFLATGRIQSARLKQLARSNEISGKDRARIEYMSWLITKDVAEKLHKIGFMHNIVSNALPSEDKANKTVKADPDGLTPEQIKEIKMLTPMDSEVLRVKLEKRLLEAIEEDPSLEECLKK